MGMRVDRAGKYKLSHSVNHFRARLRFDILSDLYDLSVGHRNVRPELLRVGHNGSAFE